MPEYRKDKTVEIIRWLALFPVAIFGGIAAHYIIIMLNLIAVELNAYPGSFYTILIGRCVGNFFLGSTSVVIASIVAPFYKKQLTLVMAGILILASCFFLVISVLAADYKGTFMAFSIIVGSFSSACFTLKKRPETAKIDLFAEK